MDEQMNSWLKAVAENKVTTPHAKEMVSRCISTIARLEAELERVTGEVWTLRDLAWKANNLFRHKRGDSEKHWVHEYSRYAESIPALSARQNGEGVGDV